MDRNASSKEMQDTKPLAETFASGPKRPFGAFASGPKMPFGAFASGPKMPNSGLVTSQSVI